MTEYLELKVSELRLGDCVQLFEGAYGTAIVNKRDDKEVGFYRHYGGVERFSYGGTGNGPQVICYVGLETFSRPITDGATVKVWRRETIT